MIDADKFTETAKYIQEIADRMRLVKFPEAQVHASVFVAEQLVVAKEIAETVFGNSAPQIVIQVYDRMKEMFGVGEWKKPAP